MHLLGDVDQVGELTLAVVEGEDAAGQAGVVVQFGDEGRHTAFLQCLVPAAHLPLQLQGVFVAEVGDRLEGVADEGGGGGEAHEVHAVGPFHRQEEPAPFLGRRGEEDGAAA